MAEVDVLGGTVELLELKVGSDEVATAGVHFGRVHVSRRSSSGKAVLSIKSSERQPTSQVKMGSN